MSFEATIGRIDQILQFQQQVLDPGAATSAPASATSGTGSSYPASTAAGTSTTATDFASALSSAQAASEASALSGLDQSSVTGDGSLSSSTDPATSVLASLVSGLGTSALGTSGASALGTSGASLLGASGTSLLGTSGLAASSAAPDPRVQAMLEEANSLVGKPYVWGGGHSSWEPQTGYDCSGFVSAVLHAGGYLSSPQDTATLPTAPGIEAGPGQSVTIYDRDESGQQGHVIIDIGGQFFESGGEAGAWGGGGGVERIATPSASYLATFNDVLHPAGL